MSIHPCRAPRRLRVSLAAALLAAALPAQSNGQGTLAVDAAMDRVYERFTRAYRLGLPDSVVVLYTDRPLYLPGQGPVLEGREALRSQFAFLDQLRRIGATAHIAFESVERGSSGEIAYDVGYYTIVVEQADGTRRPPNRGKFTTVWRRDPEGQWRIHVDGFSPAPPPARPRTVVPDSATAYLDAAREVGKWLRGLSGESGDIPIDALRPGTGASLAEGAAGTVLFLSELARATRAPEDIRLAEAAADRLIELLPAEMARDGVPPATSLYYGAPGIAIALLSAAEVSREPRYVDAVGRVAQWAIRTRGSAGHDGWSAFNDVLFGDAGTALFLLHAADILDDDASRVRAAEAGHALIRRARRQHGGLTWVLREGGTAILPNFSHGAAGIGYLLVRLHQAVGDSAFLEAALGAARYLQAIGSVDSSGALRIPYGLDRPEWSTRYDPGWGHGAAGSARFFELLHRVTGDPRWTRWVEAADRAVRTAGLDDDVSLDRRFGLAGIAEFQLDLAEGPNGGPHLALARSLVDTILAHGVRDEAGLRWSAPRPPFMADPGVPGQLTGLLHGAAGYGLLLLRLDAALRGRDWTLRLPDSPW